MHKKREIDAIQSNQVLHAMHRGSPWWLSNLTQQLTPANKSESPQILPVWEEGHEDEAVEVQALHKDPVVVSGQEVEEHCHHHLASNL